MIEVRFSARFFFLLNISGRWCLFYLAWYAHSDLSSPFALGLAIHVSDNIGRQIAECGWKHKECSIPARHVVAREMTLKCKYAYVSNGRHA